MPNDINKEATVKRNLVNKEVAKDWNDMSPEEKDAYPRLGKRAALPSDDGSSNNLNAFIPISEE